jgi:flavin-dependent dehydrogenase
MRTRNEEADVIIIGAGPASSLAGATLANRGRSVIALEREYFPRFVIGESQLPRSTMLLEQAGLLDAVLARNFMKKYAATFKLGNEVVRYCFADGLPGDPPMAFQTPRGQLDQVLATAARGKGVDVRFGQQVESVDLSKPDRVSLAVTDLETQEKQTYTGKWLLDCSGFGRVLPRLFNLEAEPCLVPRTACFTMFEGDNRPSGSEEGDIWCGIVPNVGWCWLIPFSDGRTSTGFLADTKRYDALPGSDRDRLLALLKLEPNCAERLRDARAVNKVQRLAGWTRIVKQMYGPRWAVVGNAGDFIDPIFSSGVMLAMESGTLVGQLADRELAGDRVDWMSEYQDPIKKATDVFRGFVESWYEGDLVRILFATDPSEGIRRSIVSILGGNVRNPKNSLVRQPEKGLKTLLHAIESRKRTTVAAVPA